MSKNAIRVSEMVAAMAMFEVGSTTLFLLGAKAKQDAWLAMLFGACGGFLLLLMHLGIFRLDSKRDLFELCLHYLGKVAGGLTGLFFIAYFTYEASRVVRDLGELAEISLLNRTPLLVVLLVTVLVTANTVRYGPRSVFLICLTLLPSTVMGYVFLAFIIPATGLAHPEFLLPVLENGLRPVLEAAFPEIVSFPFGQVVVFLVFFKLLMPVNRRQLNKAAVLTYSIVALVLTALNQLVIFVLGPKLAANTTYPLLEVVQVVQIADVFERMDALFALILFLGLGCKIVLFFCGAAIGLRRITGLNYYVSVVLLGAAILGLSWLSPIYTEFIWIGLKVVNVWVWPVFQIILPLLLLITMLIRKKKRLQQPDDQSPSKAEKA